MTEHRLQSKFVPLRVRIRAAGEPGQGEQEQPSRSASNGSMPQKQEQAPDMALIFDAQQRSRQIKELLRLNNLLRADLGLEEVLHQMAASIASCTGFRTSVINLIDEEQRIVPVAFAGMPEDMRQTLRNGRDPVDTLLNLMRPEFRISQSYFISHEYAGEVLGDITRVPSVFIKEQASGGWHPEDMLLVPLFSPREQKLLGFLSLDDPEDGRVPTEESIEVAELFANQAAIAIDNARLFQEREVERIALEEGITLLREDMEQLRHGNLGVHIRCTHPKLAPIVDATNAMIETISSILGGMQMVAQAVDEHTRSVQRNSEFLVRDATHQEQQVNQISQVIRSIANMMHSVSERAAVLSKTAIEAVDVTVEAQGAVDRAVDGMAQVREATLQSGRSMKVLSEGGQEINDAVLAITDLTIRMHHLALNAAIEATRAGEHGQGFAVIAQEIRTLAAHSSEAARKVGTYIRTIQQETAAVSQSVEQSTQQVIMQTELVMQTGVALDAVNVITEQLSNLIQGIYSTVQNQEQGSQLVVGSVQEILRMTGDITQHTREVQQSLSHLVELSNSLRLRMTIFRPTGD
jgi:methyl-accepting chemotaxis protein